MPSLNDSRIMTLACLAALCDEAHEIGKREFKLKLPYLRLTTKPEASTHFAVGLNNTGCPASLEVGKLYRVIPDDEAATEGYLRVVDESGEDYAFAADRFYVVQLPASIEKTLLAKGARNIGLTP